MSAPREKSGIAGLRPYVAGQRAIPGVVLPIKLSSNESPLGPSPRALEAYHAAAAELFRYPDGAQTELRAAIAEAHGLEFERIVCGNGSDELIQLLIRAYLAPGDGVVISQHSFIMARIHAVAQGAEVVTAPEPGFHVNVDELLARVTPRTRLVVLASPNNPCGTYLPRAQLERLHAALSPDVLLLLDNAYADYVTAADYGCGLELARRADNVFATRTFSKLYGLAGLRIGWGYGAAPMIASINRIRTPFNTNAPALAAATAAVRDREYARHVRDHNSEWLRRMTTGLVALGLEVVPSVANFLLVRFPAAPRDAVAAHRYLLEQGIIPRPLGTDGPDNCLRITIGLAQENEAVLAALAAFMAPGGAHG